MLKGRGESGFRGWGIKPLREGIQRSLKIRMFELKEVVKQAPFKMIILVFKISFQIQEEDWGVKETES